MSVQQVQLAVPSREFSEWMILENIQPWGQRKLELLIAGLAAVIANTVRDPKTRKTPFETKDFLVDREERWKEILEMIHLPEKTPEQERLEMEAHASVLLAKVIIANKALGGIVK